MPSYPVISLMKVSLIKDLESYLITEGYTIGDLEGQMKIYDSWVEPETFSLPAIAIDFDVLQAGLASDLGKTKKYTEAFYLHIFARDNYEQDFLSGNITEHLLNNSIEIKDYNLDGLTHLGYARVSLVESTPVRVETPDKNEEHRARISTVLYYEKDC